MAKKEYKFDPQTLTYELIKAPFRLRFYRLLRRLLIGFILASVVNFLFSWFFYTPKMYFIERDNREMVMKYEILQARMEASARKLNGIRHRDKGVYRPLFGQDTLSLPAVYAPYPDSKYAPMAEDKIYSTLTVPAWKKLDALARMIYLESVSMDQLQLLSFDKERMALSIPAIWPIDRGKWYGRLSYFSNSRFHPILKVYRPHRGLDLSAPHGTDIYATGSGKVVENQYRGGYGRQILIDHGFGYKTRYAHLSESYVQLGQEVRRGETIGAMGSTGVSQGPHLHYEVIYMNQYQNPLKYFNLDMGADELDKIIETAKEEIFDVNE
jgi:hypothetical protein